MEQAGQSALAASTAPQPDLNLEYNDWSENSQNTEEKDQANFTVSTNSTSTSLTLVKQSISLLLQLFFLRWLLKDLHSNKRLCQTHCTNFWLRTDQPLSGPTIRKATVVWSCTQTTLRASLRI